MRGVVFNELSTFVAVAEQRNFTQAAARLGLAPPTVSQTIRALEERLGVRLLNRTTRSVALTQAGETLLARMQRALREVDEALDDVNLLRDTPAGSLRLIVARTPALQLLAPLVPRFLADFPAIKFEIAVSDSRVDLVSQRFDAGIHIEHRIEKDMVTKRFYPPFKFIAVAAPSYLDQHARLKSPADLNAHNCIRQRLPFDTPVIPWEFEKQGQRLAVAVDGPLTVDDPHFALNTVLAGAGIGYFPEPFVARFLADGRLRAVFKDWAAQSAGLFLYYPSRRQLPAPLQAFLKFVDANKPTLTPPAGID
ncbi:MAG TPA: LysR substrate-binding domain-containing protein [Methylovirgula sp.]|jgi:DNA-binding transcriptional LysR family regulator|nr:LysR substrate-binding domain-containing protein [Methylovirgula sp.]